MNRKFVKENKQVLREFIGKLLSNILLKRNKNNAVLNNVFINTHGASSVPMFARNIRYLMCSDCFFFGFVDNVYSWKSIYKVS